MQIDLKSCTERLMHATIDGAIRSLPPDGARIPV